jgi:drug/metabolite transporter (DMT)-like permease
LTAMAAVVGGVRLAGDQALGPLSATGWEAILGLAIVTALSRLMMFAGLQRLGGAQTALLGITELITTLLVAFVILGERLSAAQWIGAAIIIASVLLVRREKAEE